MPTQYTPILKIALPVTGELSGTWGDVVNDNITSMFEQAIAGLATINTWTTNSHTLTTANGVSSESRCAMLLAQDGAGLSAAGEIICPAASKLYVLKNASSYSLTLKTSGGTGVAVPSGQTAFLFCDGTNVNPCVTTIVDGQVTGNLTVGGNTTLGDATSDTITLAARFVSDLLPATDNARDIGSASNSWKDLYLDGTAFLALVDINGGSVSGVRVDPRVSSTTSTASVTPDIASFDQYCFTAQAATLTINAPTGTPVDGNKLIFRILDNGTPQTLSWNATYTAIGVVLPTITTASKMLYVGCIYNAANTRWDVVAVTTQS